MATYEIEMNGQKFSIDAPDDQAVTLAVKQLQAQQGAQSGVVPGKTDTGVGRLITGQSGVSPQVDQAKQQNDYYSSGIYSGAYNPLGPIARSLDAFSSAAQQAPLMGWGDEAASAVLPGSYQGNLQQIQGRTAAQQASNPVASTAGEIAGSAVGLAPFAAALPSALLPQGAGLAARAAVGAGEGAGLGAIYGAGNTTGDQSRMTNAEIGAALGGAVGGAVPLVARGASAIYNALMNRSAVNAAATQAGTSPEVARMLANTMEADGSLGVQGQANMARAGQEAMLADAGPNARSVLDTAIQNGGPGTVLARNAIDDRVARGGQDLTSVLDQTLGAPQGVDAAQTAIRQGSAPARQAAYDAAYTAPIDYGSQRGQELAAIVQHRVPDNIVGQANRLMQLEGNAGAQMVPTTLPDGTVRFDRMPDVQQLDYITRALNQAAESGEGAGALGGQTTLGRAYQGLSREIRSNLRQAVPEYGTALDTAADPIRQSQAVDLGSRLLSPSVKADQVGNAVQGMSAAERTALAQGIRSDIENRVSNVTRTVQDGNTDAREGIKAIKDLSSRANRTKVGMAIGDAQANQLFDEIDRISTSFELRAAVAENSRTYARQAVNRTVDATLAPGPVGEFLQGKPLQAGKRLAQIITQQTPEQLNTGKQRLYSEIAQYLTRPAGQSIPAFQAMQNYGTQTAANQARAAAIEAAISGSKPVAYPLADQLRQRIR